jgi:3-hydroxymyristoyl/3-hydroxydecanoyl-(acyl carrier protein) dehydratase
VTALRIPHREPFLLVSRLEAVSGNEARFAYDLPRHGDTFGLQMFPELVMVEALAQAAAAFHGEGAPDGTDEEGVLAAVDKVRISGRPRPGDSITLKLVRTKVFGALVLFRGQAWGAHRLLLEAELTVRRGAP